MLKKQAPNAQVGLGVFLNKDGFAHSGTNVGFPCLALAMPGRGSGFVIMTNGDNGGLLIREVAARSSVGEAAARPAASPRGVTGRRRP